MAPESVGALLAVGRARQEPYRVSVCAGPPSRAHSSPIRASGADWLALPAAERAKMQDDEPGVAGTIGRREETERRPGPKRQRQ